jgi:sulfite reductase alpha subunit-like flavoprotein
MQDQANMLNELLIDRGGYFLVSGNSKNMPQAVQAVLKDVFNDETFVDTMIKNGRYQEETWA